MPRAVLVVVLSTAWLCCSMLASLWRKARSRVATVSFNCAIALSSGVRLTPGRVALAASLDRPTLFVARRPIVTVLSSGDELRSPGEPARPGGVVESNGYFVAATARAAGAVGRPLAEVGVRGGRR